MSSTPQQNLFVQWSGCATYNQTIYRVVVIAPRDVYRSEVCKAINTAGGFNPQIIDDGPCPDKKLVQDLPPEARFQVTFMPDPRYTIGANTKKEARFLLKSSTVMLHDGEFMEPPKHLRKKTPGLARQKMRLR